MKILVTETQLKKIISENRNFDFKNVKFKLRNPKKNVLLFVPTIALLKQHQKDNPSFSILDKSNQIGNRVEKAKQFIINYIEDQTAIHPISGGRADYLGVHHFEPSMVYLDYDGKLDFEDGRHRVLAAYELGIQEVPIEVSTNQADDIRNLLNV